MYLAFTHAHEHIHTAVTVQYMYIYVLKVYACERSHTYYTCMCCACKISFRRFGRYARVCVCVPVLTSAVVCEFERELARVFYPLLSCESAFVCVSVCDSQPANHSPQYASKAHCPPLFYLHHEHTHWVHVLSEDLTGRRIKPQPTPERERDRASSSERELI